jgi:biopolymer transport protein ExbB
MHLFSNNPLPGLPLANIVVDTFVHGGILMWPLLVLSLVTLAVIVDRLVFWAAAKRHRENERLNRIYHALAHGDNAGADELARGSDDPRARVIAYGLEHADTDLGIAMEAKVAEEIKASRRYVDVLDTAITLAPLLGLLGTVTGIMQSFKFVGGDQELAASKVSGGVGEALIATAFGLGIAITTLIPFNAFGSRTEALRLELEAVLKHVHLLTEKARRKLRRENLVPADDSR